MTNTLINGEAKETININDRGLQYGDGLFETMAVRNGKISLWQEHWQRLTLGCEKLSINLPNKESIEKDIFILCKEQSDTQFVIKLIVTRGEGQRGYRFSKGEKATRIISCYAWPGYSNHFQIEGVAVRYCETILSENEKLAGIKHLNRLEQVLARNEWDDDFQEGLMFSAQGYVVDGTMSNFFLVKDNKVFTPDLSLSGVAGVMRQTIINLAKKMGLTLIEKKLTRNDIETADELFLSNSLFGIWPIRQIEDMDFTVVGEITKQLQKKVDKSGH